MMVNNISLIISTFKREKQLNEIIKSLKNQLTNDLNLEIIICDSGSGYNISNFEVIVHVCFSKKISVCIYKR